MSGTLDCEIENGVLRRWLGDGPEAVVPPEATGIGDEAFAENEALRRVVLPDGLRRIGEAAFRGCLNLCALENFPDRPVALGESSFFCCPGLADASGLVVVGDTLFGCFGGNKTVTVPEGVRVIGLQAFVRARGVTRVTLPGSVRVIGECAFSECAQLRSLDLPEGLETIRAYAFEDCTSLRIPRFPRSLRRIGDSAFSGCRALAPSVRPPAGARLGEGVFFGCEKMADDRGFVIVNDVLFYARNPADGEVVIPEGVTRISSDVFREDLSLTRVVFPQSLQAIDREAFWGCAALEELCLPAGVTRVGEMAFCRCRGLKRAVLPPALQTVGRLAFSGIGDAELIADERAIALLWDASQPEDW